ncbi:MAG: hypothetical protein ACTTK0_09305 [Stomatobaculum sp.]
MSLLEIIDLLCEVTNEETDLLRELVTELEHTKQISREVKNYYRQRLDHIESNLDTAGYKAGKII